MGRLVLKHANLKSPVVNSENTQTLAPKIKLHCSKNCFFPFVLGWGGRVTASGVLPAEAGLFPTSTS
jgi:hypothetical protein